jgi:hypothetical protein
MNRVAIGILLGALAVGAHAQRGTTPLQSAYINMAKALSTRKLDGFKAFLAPEVAVMSEDGAPGTKKDFVSFAESMVTGEAQIDVRFQLSNWKVNLESAGVDVIMLVTRKQGASKVVVEEPQRHEWVRLDSGWRLNRVKFIPVAQQELLPVLPGILVEDKN